MSRTGINYTCNTAVSLGYVHTIPNRSCAGPRGVGGGVLEISSDGDDRRIFWGLKFSIPGLFWVRNLAWVA